MKAYTVQCAFGQIEQNCSEKARIWFGSHFVVFGFVAKTNVYAVTNDM